MGFCKVSAKEQSLELKAVARGYALALRGWKFIQKASGLHIAACFVQGSLLFHQENYAIHIDLKASNKMILL